MSALGCVSVGWAAGARSGPAEVRSQVGTAGRQLPVGSRGGPELWECREEACPGPSCILSFTWGAAPRLPTCPTLLLRGDTRQGQSVAPGTVAFRGW